MMRSSRSARRRRVRAPAGRTGIVEDRGIAPAQFPGVEEGRPVDVLGQRGRAAASTTRTPVNPAAAARRRPSRWGCDWRGPASIGMQLVVLVAARRAPGAGARSRREVFSSKAGPQFIAQQRADHADRARGVEHMDDRVAVMLRDLHRRVRLAGGRAADEQRDVKIGRSISLATWTISSSDGVMSPLRPMTSRLPFARGLEDFLAGDHDAEVDDLVVVAVRARRRRCSCRCHARRP